MSCSPFDLRDYFLKELPDPDRRQVETHVRACAACREELDRLRITEAALFALRDEETPQRIAFISDPVFEPPTWRRWWGAFWGSAARLGFASVAMASIAIVVFALTRPAPAPVVTAPRAAVATLTSDQVQAQIRTAVAAAVRESEARWEEKTMRLVADAEERAARERKRTLELAQAWIDEDRMRTARLRMASGNYEPPARGPVQEAK